MGWEIGFLLLGLVVVLLLLAIFGRLGEIAVELTAARLRQQVNEELDEQATLN